MEKCTAVSVESAEEWEGSGRGDKTGKSKRCCHHAEMQGSRSEQAQWCGMSAKVTANRGGRLKTATEIFDNSNDQRSF